MENTRLDASVATAGAVCELGTDPARFLECFENWYEHHSLLADTVGVQDNAKLKVLLLWGGKDFRKFAKDAGVVSEGETTDTLAAAIVKLRTKCGSHVNLSMAMFKLMHAKQGTKTMTEFTNEIEELAVRCQFDSHPYNKERAMKDALIFGTSDEQLRREALAKDYDLKQITDAALGFEQSRKSAGAIKKELAQEPEDCRRMYTENQVEELVAKLQAGKFSFQQHKSKSQDDKCPNCPPHYRPHRGRCPALGKTCVKCKKKNHFSGSRACPSTGTVRNVNEEETYQFCDDGDVNVMCIENIRHTQSPEIREKGTMVNLEINKQPVEMFVDSGCNRTLLPFKMYKPVMGPLEEANIQFRPYGTSIILKCHGSITATIQAQSGVKYITKVFVVDGHLAEPLLGRHDAMALGILKIDKEGKPPKQMDAHSVNLVANHIRASGIDVRGDIETPENISVEAKQRMDMIIKKHASVFSGIGLLKGEDVKFHIDRTVPPVADAFRGVPLAYQQRLSDHLQVLRDNNKIEDVDPSKHHGWQSNVVITEKKAVNQIRMNVDMRNPNTALHSTPQHIETIQEIRHKLEGATRFSEMDLSHGYHQVSLEEGSRDISTFMTHEGLHRFKVLFFGAAPATDLFHQKIKAALVGLNGCISIHDNILVWGKDDAEHAENVDACLTRITERGLTLRREKCNFGKTSVKWFGYIFSKSGMSADPEKVQAIKEAGRPLNSSEMKSFLQACQFNAKFMFDSEEAYAQLTSPLRKLTCKNARYLWTEECEEAYQKVIHALSSKGALRPFNPKLKTKLITDASPVGISASLYQEQQPNVWIPVDHVSRSLQPAEQNYAPIEKESLAQAWGMNMFWYHLSGIYFDSYTDHEPLLSIFGGNKRGNGRVERHRLKVQDLKYTMKYIPGKENPTDYASRHPKPITEYTDSEQRSMLMDEDDELCISRIITSDLPDAVTLAMVQKATGNDPVSKKLMKAIEKGYIDADAELKPFQKIFHELITVNGVILKGEKLYIPDTELSAGSGSLQRQCVELAHEGHQGETKTKKLLRAKLWFPGLDKMIEQKVQECHGCQATTSVPHRDPLQPTTLPERPWAKIDMDFWGPTPSGEHLLLMIDEYSRYPVVEFVRSTSADAVVPHIDKVFSTHGFPDRVKTDGGPPFNGTGSHGYYQYMKWAGVESRCVTPEDPEANGLAENFMKNVKKIWHSAIVEKKNPRQELYKFLRNYRSTPHSSTGKSPAEALFNREIKTRLPQIMKPTDDQAIRDKDAAAKAMQKFHKDANKTVRPHNIKVGDAVLIQRKQTKSKSRYDPDPFRVSEVRGTQITATRDHTVRTRDAQKFKKIQVANPKTYESQREPFIVHPAKNTAFRFIPIDSGDSAYMPNQRNLRPRTQTVVGVGGDQQPSQQPAEVPMDDMHTHDFQSGSRETARVPRAQTAADIGERQQHSLQSVEPPTNDARPYWRKTSRKQQLLRNFKGTATPD